MRRAFLSIALFFSTWMIHAQIAPSKYFIEFTDKNGTPFSVNQPSEFLSQKAINRRVAQQIQVTEQDLPVNPSYVEQVAAIGVTVINRAKWFNGVVIFCDDSTRLEQVGSLPFVKKIVKNRRSGRDPVQPVDKFSAEASIPSVTTPSAIKSTVSYNYGPSWWQIRMMNGDQLHNMGFRGQGKTIAVLDAGFYQVDLLNAFDSLRTNNQILGTRDFVNPGGNVYQENIHGMCVLSVMGGNLPGTIIGTAPKASYWLLRSEDGNSEYLIEEYNWVCAAEFADSAGADIITSSLGYTTFLDTSTSHTCDEMNGNTTPVTRGANIASLKGMAVLCSAGNEGTNPNWPCVSAPADGDNVLAIGAVDSTGQYASFSSKGVVDGDRVKPNVSAMGKNTWVYWSDNTLVQRNGTSFSCPLVAGLTACLWQAKQEITPARLYSSIQESASQYSEPDSLIGYGIPDFSQALNILGISPGSKDEQKIYPNPFTDRVTLTTRLPLNKNHSLHLFDVTGKPVLNVTGLVISDDGKSLTLRGLSVLKPGYYLIRVIDGSSVETYGVIRSGE